MAELTDEIRDELIRESEEEMGGFSMCDECKDENCSGCPYYKIEE